MSHQIDRLLTAEQVAKKLGVTPAGVYMRRQRGNAPPAIKIGKLVRWRESVVDAWIDAHEEADGQVPA